MTVRGQLAGRLVVWAFVAAAVAAAAAVTVEGDDQEEYNRVVAQLRKELAMPFTDPNDPGLHQRRVRLRRLFASVPGSHAKTLYARLGVKPTADDLSKAFHHTLASATRQELLDILTKIPAPAATAGPPATPPAPSAPPFVLPTEPLPPSETGRFNDALKELEGHVDDLTVLKDQRRWRYRCWFEKLKAGADDRVVEWDRICPKKTGAIGAAYIVGACPMTMKGVDQDELYKKVRTVPDVEKFGDEVGIFTYLRSDIVFGEDLSANLQIENLRSTHDRVIAAIDKLDKWANNPMGGSSAMPKEYVSIKDWIGQKQRDPKSVYSCK